MMNDPRPASKDALLACMNQALGDVALDVEAHTRVLFECIDTAHHQSAGPDARSNEFLDIMASYCSGHQRIPADNAPLLLGIMNEFHESSVGRDGSTYRLLDVMESARIGHLPIDEPSHRLLDIIASHHANWQELIAALPD